MEISLLDPDSILEPYIPNWTHLETADREAPFMEAAFYLLREAAQLTAIVASLVPENAEDRNTAIIQGFMVRCGKLLRLLLRELAAKETFQQLSVFRSLLESLGTLRYLLGDEGTGERFDQYVMNSLIVERELLRTIEDNIASRDGNILEIEGRMRRSIDAAAKAAGVSDVSALPGRNKIGFPSAEARVKLLGPNAYVAYRTGSAEVHGDWNDLFRNHLIYDNGKFAPNPDSLVVRPQAPLSATVIVCEVVTSHADVIIPRPEERGYLVARLDDLKARALRLTALHEAQLARAVQGSPGSEEAKEQR